MGAPSSPGEDLLFSSSASPPLRTLDHHLSIAGNWQHSSRALTLDGPRLVCGAFTSSQRSLLRLTISMIVFDLVIVSFEEV